MIDWKIDKTEKISKILEEMGYAKSEKHEIENIKQFIMRVLTDSKNGKTTDSNEFTTILSNIDKCDHFDLVRTDSVITRNRNETDKEYRWGSVVQNLKWKY